MKEVMMMDHKVDSWRIGKILRDIRLWTKCSQAEIGKRLGKTQSYVSQLELGKIQMSIYDIEKICSSFDGLEVENFTQNKPINWTNVC